MQEKSATKLRNNSAPPPAKEVSEAILLSLSYNPFVAFSRKQNTTTPTLTHLLKEKQTVLVILLSSSAKLERPCSALR